MAKEVFRKRGHNKNKHPAHVSNNAHKHWLRSQKELTQGYVDVKKLCRVIHADQRSVNIIKAFEEIKECHSQLAQLSTHVYRNVITREEYLKLKDNLPLRNFDYKITLKKIKYRMAKDHAEQFRLEDTEAGLMRNVPATWHRVNIDKLLKQVA